MKKLLFLLLALLVMASCTETKTNKSTTDSKEKPISDLSIYNLPEKWTNQNGKEVTLKEFRGSVLVMVMIYTSCKAACPRLVADMRHIEERILRSNKDNVKFILVSMIQSSTPEQLKRFL